MMIKYDYLERMYIVEGILKKLKELRDYILAQKRLPSIDHIQLLEKYKKEYVTLSYIVKL